MSDPTHGEWNHPRTVQVRELEAEAHRLFKRVFEEIGPGEVADCAYNLRVSLTKMLVPYRRSMAEHFRSITSL